MDYDASSPIARVGAKGRSQEIIEKKRAPRNANFVNQEIDLLVILVGDRVKARRDNSQSNINPSVEEWNYIHSQFNFRSTNESREKHVLKNKWKTLRSEYSFFKDLASRSGHGWNEEKGIPDLTEEAWDDYIKMDARRYKPFRNKSFPWFRAMEEICGNSIATGNMQHSSDPSVPIAHNFHSESSDDDRNGDDVSPVEIHNAPIDLDVNETFDFFSDFQDLGSGHVPCQMQHANTSSSMRTLPLMCMIL